MSGVQQALVTGRVRNTIYFRCPTPGCASAYTCHVNDLGSEDQCEDCGQDYKLPLRILPKQRKAKARRNVPPDGASEPARIGQAACPATLPEAVDGQT